MTVPLVPTWHAQVLIDAHTALLALVDAGTAGSVKVRDAADVLLATIVLTDPAGTVHGTTGQLTITDAGPVNAVASGTAAYAELCSSAGTVYLALPAQQGVAAVSGYAVLNTLVIVSGLPVELISFTIG
jgi:hypothetical protein